MKNGRDPLYLTARQAAGELSVSPATLYAYVSRGLIRSEPVEASRQRRYRAEDVRALKGRRGAAGVLRCGETEPPLIETSVSTIAEGGPIYRGVDANLEPPGNALARRRINRTACGRPTSKGNSGSATATSVIPSRSWMRTAATCCCAAG